jgi:UDP-N-acetylmuramate dehydrogenase
VVSAPDGADEKGAAQALRALADALDGPVVRDAPLGARTTYRVGGPGALLVEARTEADLAAVHRALVAVAAPVPVLVLGQGSNLLVADAGFPGLVVVLGGEFEDVEVQVSAVHAGGAAKLPVVARRTAAVGLRGFEWAVGVPGSVGGALRMNAGGHGSDVATSLSACRIFDLATGTACVTGPERLAFAYRSSALGPAHVVVWAEFTLTPGDPVEAEAVVADIVRWRRVNQPGGSNAGSVFVNPEGDSAGRLVEAAGLKGLRLGTAVVSPKHANFIQADTGGRADDVWRLVEHVRATVRDRTGVDLVPEVRLAGFPGPLPLVRAVTPGPGTGTDPSTSTGGRDS